DVDQCLAPALLDPTLERAERRVTRDDELPEELAEELRGLESHAGTERHEHVEALLSGRLRITHETDLVEDLLQREREHDGALERVLADVEIDRQEVARIARRL